MPLTKEQLFQDRFKFMMPYPGSHWRIGDVFESIGGDIYKTKESPIRMMKSVIEAYPEIFQRLPWWCDRKIEEMPEYIVDTNLVFHKAKWKYHPHGLFMYLDDEMDNGWHVIAKIMCFYAPATSEEYTAYINQKQQ